MNTPKTCENCLYYQDYYIICRARLKRIGGYCSNSEVYPYVTKNRYNPKPCQNWRQKPPRAEKEVGRIKNVLKDMQKTLAEISIILEDDEI